MTGPPQPSDRVVPRGRPEGEVLHVATHRVGERALVRWPGAVPRWERIEDLDVIDPGDTSSRKD